MDFLLQIAFQTWAFWYSLRIEQTKITHCSQFTYLCNGLSCRMGSRLIKARSTLSNRLLIVRNTASLANDNLTTKSTYKNGGNVYSNFLNRCASKSGFIRGFMSRCHSVLGIPVSYYCSVLGIPQYPPGMPKSLMFWSSPPKKMLDFAGKSKTF